MSLRRAASGRLSLDYRRWARARLIEDESLLTKRAWKIVRGKRYCLVITGSGENVSARVVEPFSPDSDGAIRFGTDPNSRKVAQIVESGRCLLAYQDDRRRACVILECDARVVTSANKAWFRQAWRAFWPEGPGVDFINVECTPTAIEVWDGLAVVAPEPFGRRSARIDLKPQVP